MENRNIKNVYKNEEKIKLWTIQHKEAFEKFEKTGFLRADNSHVFCEDDFRYAYDWISEQMVEKIGKPPVDDIKYPVWAWYQWEGKRKRRDLRCSGYDKRGTAMVQLEIEVPIKEILLSDFDMWCAYVMPYYYIPENEEDDEYFYNRHQLASKLTWGMGHDNSDPRLYPMLDEIRESWIKVLDIENSFKRGFYSKEQQSIQATLWQVTTEQVCKVEHFIAK